MGIAGWSQVRALSTGKDGSDISEKDFCHIHAKMCIDGFFTFIAVSQPICHSLIKVRLSRTGLCSIGMQFYHRERLMPELHTEQKTRQNNLQRTLTKGSLQTSRACLMGQKSIFKPGAKICFQTHRNAVNQNIEDTLSRACDTIPDFCKPKSDQDLQSNTNRNCRLQRVGTCDKESQMLKCFVFALC